MRSISAKRFDSINARSWQPEEVAETFVRPLVYSTVVQSFNTVILGNRGSGKTTLLKMLQLPALRVWRHPRAGDVRREIGFTAVFIPTDRLWQEQMASERAVPRIENRSGALDSIGYAAFVNHTLSCLLGSIRDRIEFTRTFNSASRSDRQLERFAVDLTKRQEFELAKSLANRWALKGAAPTLAGVAAALDARMKLLGRRRTKSYRTGMADFEGLDELVEMDFFEALGDALSSFDDLIEHSEPERWCLCFDEMEIAQSQVRSAVYDLYRAPDTRFFIKATTTPFLERRSSYYTLNAAEVDHDYHLVDLRTFSRHEIHRFSEQLVSKVVKARVGTDATPQSVLGVSLLAENDDADRTSSRKADVYRRLASRDESFRYYLDRHDLDLDRLEGEPEAKLRKTIRRVSHHALLREAYGTFDAASPRVADASLYSGVPSLYHVCEANPRLLINLTTTMLARARGSLPIPPSEQAEVFQLAAKRLLSLVRAAGAQQPSGKMGLHPLVVKIGRYLAGRQLADPFVAEPVGSVRLNGDEKEDWADLVALGENVGAFVEIQQTERSAESSVANPPLRFRLSYLLAVHYRLAAKVDKPASLSSILAQRDDSGHDRLV
jgi:hypothetical protein